MLFNTITINRKSNFMKKLLILFAIFTTVAATAQSVGINTDGSTANASAILDVSSTTKGFMPPRMTYAQRNAIATPVAGLIVYCTDCATNGELHYYNGTNWVNMAMGIAATLSIPSISTTAATNITSTSATSGGTVSSDGGSTITARGICWSTTANPTIANSITTDAGTTGIFISSLTSLSTVTTYYVCAYATNSIGTAYGTAINFTTN
jgi:hypothetical protein